MAHYDIATASSTCLGVHTRPQTPSLCRRPGAGEHHGTYSITSLGGVGSTFLLEWLKRLHRTFQHEADEGCLSSARPSNCTSCPVLARSNALPRHLVSCHIDDDGVFKHLADPASLSSFGPSHRAVYLVGSPLNALASVFRRRFQCWHMHRLQGCWFTRARRDGRIACDAPEIARLRSNYGVDAATCRVPPYGPLSSLAAYARHGTDLFGSVAQFSAWLSCRWPRCPFDILLIRYETLNASLSTLFDFLDLPPATRALFPYAKLRASRRHGALQVDEATLEQLQRIYGALDAVVARLPEKGLWLRNTAVPRARAR